MRRKAKSVMCLYGNVMEIMVLQLNVPIITKLVKLLDKGKVTKKFINAIRCHWKWQNI